MFYYFVWVRSNRYRGYEALTYSCDKRLARGSIVQVELQKILVLGIVSRTTTQPKFKTKEITYVYDLPPIPEHLSRLALWLQSYYPAPLGVLTQQLLPVNLPRQLVESEKPEKFSEIRTNFLPKLTKDQSAALLAIQKPDTYILHGQTGSGKTRLYIELALRSIKSGRSAIILTPEISLVTQLAANFQTVFGNRVIVVHSQQPPLMRQKAWIQIIRSTEPVIVIGPRSALLSPIQKLGLIVLDEAHEAAYKQEQAPQYMTGRVAAQLASVSHATLILGSATPSVSDYYLAEQKHKSIIVLKGLATSQKQDATQITIVDRKDHSQFDRSPYLSRQLVRSIEQSLAEKQQSLLYLNRRGTARLVLCENCGWQALCPHCDIPLTYHGDLHNLRCHSCDHHQPVPSNCPSCGHVNILFKTAGTKAIVDEVRRLFPQVRVERYDSDNRRSERFEKHYDSVKAGEIDILVGTQLLAKGLDLPKLSTLGVVLADTSLNIPDFSAQERTFQLLSQVLGRVGRGHVSGRAIIQTYHPNHPILIDALSGNYQHFYEREMAERRKYLFPPFCYLLKISLRRATLKSVESAANALKDAIQATKYKVRVEGPAPSFYEHTQNKFQWQLVLKATNRDELLKVIAMLPKTSSYNLDPIDLL